MILSSLRLKMRLVDGYEVTIFKLLCISRVGTDKMHV